MPQETVTKTLKVTKPVNRPTWPNLTLISQVKWSSEEVDENTRIYTVSGQKDQVDCIISWLRDHTYTVEEL